jgi:hypothetical protein
VIQQRETAAAGLGEKERNGGAMRGFGARGVCVLRKIEFVCTNSKFPEKSIGRCRPERG